MALASLKTNSVTTPSANRFDLSEASLRTLTNAKWNQYGPDILPAFVAEMDFAVADPIQDAVQAVVAKRDYGYPRRDGGKAGLAVANAFAHRMKERFDWEIDPALVVPVADLVQGTYAPVLAFTDPGDGIILQVPNYPPFRDVIRTTERNLISLPMLDDGTRHICNTEQIIDQIDSRTRMFVLCNPHNPTGRVFSRQELRDIGQFCIKHDLIVLSDEIHSDLIYPGRKHIPFASLSPELAARTVTLNSPTKSFNIPGLRCAVLHFGTSELRERFGKRIPQRLLGDPNAIGVDATIAAWTQSQPWLDEVMAHLTATRDHVVKRLEAELPEIRFRVPEGTYLAWLDCSALMLNTSAFDFFHDNARVAFSPGENFEPTCKAFVRFNFATSRVIVDQIIDRMVEAVRARKP